MKECPACQAAREAMIRSLQTAIRALEDPTLGHMLVEQRGSELACTITEVSEVISDFTAELCEATAPESQTSTPGAEVDDLSFFDQFKVLDA